MNNNDLPAREHPPLEPMDIEADQERRKSFLRYINRGLLLMGTLAVVATIALPDSAADTSVVALVSFGTFFIVRYLNRKNKITLAGYLFSGLIEATFYFLLWRALSNPVQSDMNNAIIMMLMGLPIIFAGTTIGRRAAITIALCNLILQLVVIYFFGSQHIPTFSINVYWWTLAIAIWLYESTLERALDNSLKRERDLHNEVRERQLAEEALKLSEDMYRRAIIAAGAVPYYLDHRARAYTFMGEGILAITGYTAAEMTPDLWVSLEQESFPRGNLAHLTYAEADRLTEADNAIPWECDYRIRTRDGQTRWVADTSVKGLNEKGERAGVIGILQDITDRKLAEQALQRYADRLEMLREIDHAILSAHSPEETALAAVTRIRRIVPCLRAGISLFNLETEQVRLLATSFGDIQEFGTESVSFATFGLPAITCLKQDQPFVIEDVLANTEIAVLDQQLAEEGIRAWLMVPLYDQDHLIGSLNLGRGEAGPFSTEDITIAKDVADQLTIAIVNANLYKALQTANADLEQRVVERTMQFETANKDLEAFSFSVSHDLRAPLRAVNSFSKILVDDFSNNLEPQAKRFLARVQENALKMNALIDGLLIFSRVGRQAISRRDTDLKQLAQAVYDELLEGQDPARQIAFTLSDLPTAPVDPVLYKQVFSNLLSNALKYTGKREVAQIEVGSYDEQDETLIFVRDNGTGFDMQYADKLFGVFQRLHSEAEFEGTGVGLSTVARIIQKHGGRIWAEAEPDKGATFYFTLGNAA